MNLTGKVALITGASRGIGRSIALELSRAGAYVLVNYNVDISGAEETLNLIKNEGRSGAVLKFDISKYADVNKSMQEIIKKYGKIDILINNAGISKVGIFSEMDENDWDSMIDTNLKGVFNCTHTVLKYMLPQKSGNIINISSMWGISGASCEVIYSASKGGINAFTKALAKELGPSNIRVNAIAPGVIDTEMNKWLSEDEKNELNEEIPLMRFGKAEEVGKLVVYLAGDESSYITGQVITIDGGMI